MLRNHGNSTITMLSKLIFLPSLAYISYCSKQIVRADLKELVDLDLGGAPYGYTPFCDSRKEMEGFRCVYL